jgi:probable DNA repair protein
VARTARAARTFVRRYNLWRRSRDSNGWQTPQVLAWEDWLQSLWQSAAVSGIEGQLLLNESQEHELWTGILGRDHVAQQTLSIDSLADSIQTAWRSMHQYGIGWKDLRSGAGLDAAKFYEWAQQFEGVCRKDSLLSPALIETAALDWIASTKLALPRRLFLFGFERITPAMSRVVDELGKHDCAAEWIEFKPDMGSPDAAAIVCARTFQDEAEAAARWARTQLLENSDRRIGILVPGLPGKKAILDATFRRILAPSTMDVRAHKAALPYEMSLGMPIARLRPIRTALLLLEWIGKGLKPEDVSWLVVQGEFAGGGSSLNARAILDREFRERTDRLGGPVPLEAYWRWLQDSKASQKDAAFVCAISRLLGAARRENFRKSRSLSEWRESAEEFLEAANWNLEKPGSSVDFQILRRWNTLLNEVSSLGGVLGPVGYRGFIDRLNRLATNFLFALESHDAPVQILGVAESAGIAFDAVWWMGAQIGAWPPAGKPDPFLPWGVQRQARIPYTDPDEDNTFAVRSADRILRSASSAVISFSLEPEDPREQSGRERLAEVVLSPVVRQVLPDAPITDADDFQRVDLEAEPAPRTRFLETVAEEAVIPFRAMHIGGGVTFLKHQAACPFRGFSELRLKAKPLADAEIGLSPQGRGTNIHHVLEYFWKDVRTQEKLLALSEDEVQEKLRGLIQDVLSDLSQSNAEPWSQALLEIEAEWMEQRLLEWLEVEKQRRPFETIATENLLRDQMLGGVEFDCRIDRTDRVDEGMVLLDYKTGNVAGHACDGERPDEPQLPAYSVLRARSAAIGDSIAGIAFANLQPKSTRFVPVTQLAGIFPGAGSNRKSAIKPVSAEEMEEQIRLWSEILTRLAEEFRAGVATVDPKNYPNTCKYCAQAPLCRVHEALDETASASDDDVDEENGEFSLEGAEFEP